MAGKGARMMPKLSENGTTASRLEAARPILGMSCSKLLVHASKTLVFIRSEGR